MGKFKDLLNEITGPIPRRIQLQRVEVVLGNIAPQLSAAEQKKVAEMYVELKTLVETLNVTPYTVFNNPQWKLLEMVLMGKIAEFKILVEDIAEDNKTVDCWPLVKALDTVLI